MVTMQISTNKPQIQINQNEEKIFYENNSIK